jgi:hypothetical protein
LVIGVLQLELVIDGSRSLKDKRRVITSLREKLRRAFNVSIAEIATQDDHRVATLGVVLAASDVPYCQSTLDKVLARATDARDCVLRNHRKEILTGQ